MKLDVARITSVIARDIENIDSILRRKDAVREETIKLTREIIRLSSGLVASVHAGRWNEASSALVRLRDFVDRLLNLVESHPDLKYSGLIYNALSEFVEAYMFYSIVVNGGIPTLDELRVPVIPYLQGLGDLIGELRRFVIKLLNELKVSDAENYLEIMEAIHNNLKILEYPDPLIPGVKHKLDVASKLIEDTRVLVLSTKNSIRCMEFQAKDGANAFK